MFSVKLYIGDYDKKDFYSAMGKFFAERIYKKQLPYLTNDNEKIWYLFYQEKELAGFAGVKIRHDSTLFSDIYICDKFHKFHLLNFMAEYLIEIYQNERIEVLTNSSYEREIWLQHGFTEIGQKGSYIEMRREKVLCPQ